MTLILARLWVYGGLALAGWTVTTLAGHCVLHQGCQWIYQRPAHVPCCVWPLHRTDFLICWQRETLRFL